MYASGPFTHVMFGASGALYLRRHSGDGQRGDLVNTIFSLMPGYRMIDIFFIR